MESLAEEEEPVDYLDPEWLAQQQAKQRAIYPIYLEFVGALVCIRMTAPNLMKNGQSSANSRATKHVSQ